MQSASDTGAPANSARNSRRRVGHGHGAPQPPQLQSGSTGPRAVTRVPPETAR
jgi:hypothetical protein